MAGTFDWTLIQTFLAVAETGSFTAAARQTGSSQPTVGRHVQELERQLGTALFRRQNRGHRLTGAGTRLLAHAGDMKEAAARLSLEAEGQAEVLQGVVRITASVVVSHYLLPPIFAHIRAAEPEIELELNPTDATDNLLYRDADIAIRMYRPEQLDVITRRVGTQRFGIYATRAYLSRRGTPQSIADLPHHDFIGYDRSDLMIRGMRQMGLAASRSMFAIRCDNQSVYIEMLKAGCGLGVAPINIAGSDPDLVRILPDIAIPDLPIWLTAHEALRHAPRIRRVYDLLAEGLADVAGD
ncbi:MAG: LysR family transcriptional regulator [Rhodobacteraceae bacterium]|nr:LysR family transcriptional regulator [Paracoccaceae bacterium]